MEPQEFIVINRQEDKPQKKSAFDEFERFSRIISLIAIPLILGIIGYWVQKNSGDKNLNRQYVELAINILTKEDKKIPQEIKNWAVDVLNDNSPTKFDKATIIKLKEGEINLQSLMEIVKSGTNGSGFVFSPDGKLIVTGQDDATIKLWDVGTGKLVMTLKGHSGPVTAIAVSPDARIILSGSLDGTVRMWDITRGLLISVIDTNTEGVIGVSYSPDGREIAIRSLDNSISTWSIEGQLLKTIKLTVN